MQYTDKSYKWSLTNGFHFKGELPVDVIKGIVAQCDLVIALMYDSLVRSRRPSLMCSGPCSFAMVNKECQDTLVWSSIKNLDLDTITPFAEEDRPAISRALYRRVDKLTSVESLRYESYPDLEVTHLLIGAVAPRLRRVHVSSPTSPIQEALGALNPSILETVYLSFSLRWKGTYPKLTSVFADVDLESLPSVAKCCPALEHLEVTAAYNEDTHNKYIKNWESMRKTVLSMKSLKRFDLFAPDNFIYRLLGNQSQSGFNSTVLTYIPQKVGVDLLPILRLAGKSVAEWILNREFTEPSNNEYFTIHEWCYPNETPDARSKRLKTLLESCIVTKRRKVARRALAIYVDRIASLAWANATPKPHLVVLLVTALDMAGMDERAKYWFQKFGRGAYETFKGAQNPHLAMCPGENIVWAGYLAQALKDHDWCRSSGFIDTFASLIKDTRIIRDASYNLRPGLLNLMLNYSDVLMPLLLKMHTERYSNASVPGWIGKMIADFDSATDIGVLGDQIEKILELARAVVGAATSCPPSEQYMFRTTDLWTEERSWDLGLFGYFPNESPNFQELRLAVMYLFKEAPNFFSKRNAITWLGAPDSVSMLPVKQMLAHFSEFNTGYREVERFWQGLWLGVFELVSQGKDEIRVVGRALQCSSPPSNLTDPATYHMKSINLEALRAASPGSYTKDFGVYGTGTIAKVQRGLQAHK